MDTQVLRARLPASEALTAALTGPPAGGVSAVLATYNRCPFDPTTGRLRDNPLSWALDSLLSQAGDALAEIVVVDDGSTDHTAAVLEHYQQQPGVPIRVRHLTEHRGAFAARNAAVAAASSRWLLFGDDDCVFTPHYAAGAARVLHTLREDDPTVAALMLPFYYRALWPRDVVPMTRIGRLDPARGEFATGFHAWPAEYGLDPPRFPGLGGLVAPIPVALIGGTALVDAHRLRRAGGFVDLSAWASSYSDHLYLSAALTDAGGLLYHCPDPRLSAVHLKFGAVGRYPLRHGDLDAVLPGPGQRLRDLVNLSTAPRTDTGCRVTDAMFFPEMIGSFLEFFAVRSMRGAVAWAVRIWHDFVEAGQVYSQAVATVPPYQERVAAWRDGLARAARCLVTDPPARPAGHVQQLLDHVCRKVGQPAIRCWS